MVVGLMAVSLLPNKQSAIPLRVLPGRLPSSSSMRLTPWTEHLSRINHNLIYRFYLFFCLILSFRFSVPKWNKSCPCCQCTNLFVWPRSRCVAFQHSALKKTLCFIYITILSTSQHSVEFHNVCNFISWVHNQLNFPKLLVNSKMLYKQFSNFTSLQSHLP
jgi:hypothetical protein